MPADDQVGAQQHDQREQALAGAAQADEPAMIESTPTIAFSARASCAPAIASTISMTPTNSRLTPTISPRASSARSGIDDRQEAGEQRDEAERRGTVHQLRATASTAETGSDPAHRMLPLRPVIPAPSRTPG